MLQDIAGHMSRNVGMPTRSRAFCPLRLFQPSGVTVLFANAAAQIPKAQGPSSDGSPGSLGENLDS